MRNCPLIHDLGIGPVIRKSKVLARGVIVQKVVEHGPPSTMWIDGDQEHDCVALQDAMQPIIVSPFMVPTFTGSAHPCLFNFIQHQILIGIVKATMKQTTNVKIHKIVDKAKVSVSFIFL